MGMQSLLRKVFLVDLLQGLKVTFRYQDPKEIYTEQYPMERPQVAERYRGAPRLNVNPDTDETMCIACDLCALACPENLIVVSSARNEHTRRKELTNFTYDLSRCMFCGLCEDACPVDALELTQDFELASYTREGWIWDRETLEKGPQPTLYKSRRQYHLTLCSLSFRSGRDSKNIGRPGVGWIVRSGRGAGRISLFDAGVRRRKSHVRFARYAADPFALVGERE